MDRCIERLGPISQERLEHCAGLNALAASWLEPLQETPAASRHAVSKLPRSSADPRSLDADDHRYLAGVIADRLSAKATAETHGIAALAQLPEAQLDGLFHALAQAKPLYGFAGRLVVHLADELALRFWTEATRPESFRHELLLSFLSHAEAFSPSMVEALERDAHADDSLWALLGSVLVRLAPAKARCAVDSLSTTCQQKLLMPLLGNCRLHPIARQLVEQMIDSWPAPVLTVTIKTNGEELAAHYPGQRLTNLARGLLGKLADPAAADGFSAGLDVLEHLTSAVDNRDAAAIESWLEVRCRLRRVCGGTRGPLTAWLLGSVSADETATWLKSLSQACYQSGSKTDWKHRQRLAVALWQATSGREMPADLLEAVEQQLFWPVWQAQVAAAEFDCHERPRLTLPYDAQEAPLLVFGLPADLPRWVRMDVQCRAADNTNWKRSGARSFAVPSDSNRELQISISDLKFAAADGQSLELRCLFSAPFWPADIVSMQWRPVERQALRTNYSYKIMLTAGSVPTGETPGHQPTGSTRGPVSP